MKNKMKNIILGLLLIAALSGCNPANEVQETEVTTGVQGEQETEVILAPETTESKTSEQEEASQDLPSEITFTDSLDREVTVHNPQKVAVLMGSYADVWQLSGGVVTAVTEDAYSERDLKLPEDVINVGEYKTPNIEMLIEEGIDFVILSSKTKEHVELMSTLEKVGITSAYFKVDYFEEYLEMLKICTDITGNQELYVENGTEIQGRIDDSIASSKGKESPSVLFIRAFSSGAKPKDSESMTGAMLKDLGATNIADVEGAILENLSIENIIKEDPEFVFVTTMGASSEKAIAKLNENLTSNPAWAELRAVKNDNYIILDKDLFHYKPNVRWGESYEILAEILYGE